ncbi:MAG: UDP-N-acetylmuramoyl-tripeptide--D-alanyl-D-alanine ligase [bacterium]|nr:UDP-N-acetylmuramoyl-tripeptide--D-alanyl-D-alanine ligase [bacterium]
MSFDQLAEIIKGTSNKSFGPKSVFSGVSIDSRSIQSGELFVAIRGEKQDGHRYLQQAIERQAAGLLVDEGWMAANSDEFDLPVITVPDTHKALLQMAREYRARVAPLVAAITGSNGKTTTKEFTLSLLKAVEPNAYGSPGNLNNLYGLPLTIFQMPHATKAAVLEIGISTPDEMPILAQVAQPDLVCITNVGPSHLDKLGTVEKVARAKLQLISASPESARLILNGDDAVLMRESAAIPNDILTFGLDHKADFQIQSRTTHETGQEIVIDKFRFNLPLVGMHQAANLLAAYAIVRTMGYDFKDVNTANIEFSTAPMRGQIEQIDEIRVMADCYNANPESMRSALESFMQLSAGARTVLILGDMLELGDESARLHREIGELVGKLCPNLAIFVGQRALAMREAAIETGIKSDVALHFDDVKSAPQIRELIQPGDFVLLKGSRGVELEEVLAVLRRSFAPEEDR